MSMKLQTTIVTTRDDWSIARFELLADLLRRQKNCGGNAWFAIATNDRKPLEAGDPVLLTLNRVDFDEIWLGRRELSGRRSDFAVAFEASPGKGRLIAECCFRHLTDDNWNSPGDVTDRAGEAMLREPIALASVHVYVRNVVTWLALLESDERESLA